jgi:hypothetical protein
MSAMGDSSCVVVWMGADVAELLAVAAVTKDRAGRIPGLFGCP